MRWRQFGASAVNAAVVWIWLCIDSCRSRLHLAAAWVHASSCAFLAFSPLVHCTAVAGAAASAVLALLWCWHGAPPHVYKLFDVSSSAVPAPPVMYRAVAVVVAPRLRRRVLTLLGPFRRVVAPGRPPSLHGCSAFWPLPWRRGVCALHTCAAFQSGGLCQSLCRVAGFMVLARCAPTRVQSFDGRCSAGPAPPV